jgi:hypothetical protein
VQNILVFFVGDLTDAKDAAEEVSEQQPEEWQRYADVLNRTGVRRKTVWLDIRGNHGKLHYCDFSSALVLVILFNFVLAAFY